MSLRRLFIWVGTVIVAGVLAPGQALTQAGEPNGRNPELLLAAAEHEQVVEGNLEGAIRDYNNILSTYSANHTVAAKALIEMGQCYEKLGKDEARKAYERVLHDYADQPDAAAEARVRLAGLKHAAEFARGTMVVRRAWSGPGTDIMGGPSADGQYLSFVDWSTGDLAIRDMRTGAKHHVTNKGTWAQSPEWAEGSSFSPDGRQIAFTWYAKDESVELRVAGVDGSQPRVLYANKDMYYVEAADWSPDGKNILAVLTRNDRTNQIAWISVKDGSTRVLKTFDWRGPGGGFGNVSLSPDGRDIVYDLAPHQDSDNADIFLLAADASSEVPLVQDPADDCLPTWAPDGKHVFFLSDRTGVYGLWEIEVENGRPAGPPEMVKSDIGRARPMGFTRAGSYYYGLDGTADDVYVATLDPATLKVVNAPAKFIQNFEGSNAAPDWSPDGKYLVYTSQRKGTWEGWGPRTIMIRSLDTGEERELPTRFSFVPGSQLRWSPDGHSLLFAGVDRKGRGGVFVIDARTGAAARVVNSAPDSQIGQAEWAPDGASIFFSRTEAKDKSDVLLSHELKGGQDKQLYRGSGSVAFALSRDGSRLAVLDARIAAGGDITAGGVLKVLSSTGGEARELFRLPAQEAFRGGLAWTPDGRQIIFGRQSGVPDSMGQFTQFWRISAEGGSPEKTELRMQFLSDLRFAPDGRRIAFTGGGGPGSEVWAVENLLPLKSAK